MTAGTGADLWALGLPDTAAPEFIPGNLALKFLQPPFTVLDSRKGDWQERRRAWLTLGIKSELGRGASFLHAQDKLNAIYGNEGYAVNEEQGATSVFDPVLCELAYRWFAPPGGRVLDPFAGGSVRGIVAAKLGHPYTGVDLSLPQLVANRDQAQAILSPSEPSPRWMHGDSARLDDLLPAGEEYDFIWTCPPYFDLEVYSDDPADLSAMEWPGFIDAYQRVIEQACRRLRRDRFAALVVSEVRDATGAYRGLVPLTIHAFRLAGLSFWNEAVLVNSAGSLPLRATKSMEASRKLGRSHQNVLVFLKGDPPRGWSYDRQAPPSPQLDLHLVPDPAPSTPAQAAPAAVDPVAVSVGAQADAAGPGASVAGNDQADQDWAAQPDEVVAVLEPCPVDGCALPVHFGAHVFPPQAGGDDPGAGPLVDAAPEDWAATLGDWTSGAYDQPAEPKNVTPGAVVIDGYLADPATGEVLVAPDEPAAVPLPATGGFGDDLRARRMREAAQLADHPTWTSVVPAGPPGSGATSRPPIDNRGVPYRPPDPPAPSDDSDKEATP